MYLVSQVALIFCNTPKCLSLHISNLFFYIIFVFACENTKCNSDFTARLKKEVRSIFRNSDDWTLLAFTQMHDNVKSNKSNLNGNRWVTCIQKDWLPTYNALGVDWNNNIKKQNNKTALSNLQSIAWIQIIKFMKIDSINYYFLKASLIITALIWSQVHIPSKGRYLTLVIHKAS